jgi:MFS family permease
LLGVFGSLFQPALLASVPNVVEPRQVVAAQSLVSATLHIAVVAGPAIGGYLISRLSPASVFGINAASFLLSGVLIGTVSIARNPHARTVAASGLSDLREGFRYVVSNRLARAILVVVGLVSLGAATKTPLEPLFVRDVLADGDVLGAGGRIFGLITASWGLGMLLGSVTVPGIARRWPRERLLPIGVAIVGLMVLVVSRTDDFSTVLLAWFAAGWANALGNVSYETLLQERTPDALRGRVFAVTEAIADSAYVAGALLAAGLGAILAVQDVLAIAGSVMLFGAAAGLVLLPSPGAQPAAAEEIDAQDDAAPPAAQARAGAS